MQRLMRDGTGEKEMMNVARSAAALRCGSGPAASASELTQLEAACQITADLMPGGSDTEPKSTQGSSGTPAKQTDVLLRQR